MGRVTASGHQPAVGPHAPAQQDALSAGGVAAGQLQETAAVGEGLDCYSLELDSTWEVVEQVRDIHDIGVSLNQYLHTFSF